MEIELKHGRAICRPVASGYIAQHMDTFGQLKMVALITAGRGNTFAYAHVCRDGSVRRGLEGSLEEAVAAVFGTELVPLELSR
jgi:hypothetical protein